MELLEKKLIKGLETWFSTNLLPAKIAGENVVSQGGHVTFDGKYHYQEGAQSFAVDCQTWGMLVLGSKRFDTWYKGKQTAYGIWQAVKKLAGYYINNEIGMLGIFVSFFLVSSYFTRLPFGIQLFMLHVFIYFIIRNIILFISLFLYFFHAVFHSLASRAHVLAGVGYTTPEKNTSSRTLIWSGEWTWGAVYMTRRLASEVCLLFLLISCSSWLTLFILFAIC
jgi:hypothetical protein